MLCALTHKYCERKCAIGKCFIMKQAMMDAKRLQEGAERRKPRVTDFNVESLPNGDFNVTPVTEYYANT